MSDADEKNLPWNEPDWEKSVARAGEIAAACLEKARKLVPNEPALVSVVFTEMFRNVTAHEVGSATYNSPETWCEEIRSEVALLADAISSLRPDGG